MTKRKLVVEYNEGDRRDYLLGFRKRKQQRRKVAQDHINEQTKQQKHEERKEVSTSFRDIWA